MADGGRVSLRSEPAARVGAMRIVLLVALVLAALGHARAVFAAECGGAVVCQCGDVVAADYTMAAGLACPRLPSGDTVGLKVRAGVTLDCGGHVITGPGDTLKDAFGI